MERSKPSISVALFCCKINGRIGFRNRLTSSITCVALGQVLPGGAKGVVSDVWGDPTPILMGPSEEPPTGFNFGSIDLVQDAHDLVVIFVPRTDVEFGSDEDLISQQKGERYW